MPSILVQGRRRAPLLGQQKSHQQKELFYLGSHSKGAFAIRPFEGSIVNVPLPPSVLLEVTETAPGLEKVAATDVTQPAHTDTGLLIPVPVFINVGDRVKVSTEDGRYLERVNTG